MEEKFNGGQEYHEERRDYAGKEGSTGNYSAEGRKLRPRRKVGSYSNDNHRNYSEGNRTGRPSYGQNSERRSYGQSRPRYGEDRSSYGSDRPRFSQDRPQRGESRPRYGESKPRYGEGKPRYSEDRPSYGEGRPTSKMRGQRPATRKPVRKNGPHFTANDEAGINQMLSRKPQIENRSLSDNDNVATPIKEEIRLNKFIANSGVCSRREADTLIQAGVVTVNGEVVTELGTKVNVLKDDIRFNGERLKGEEKVYIVMNKPKGYVTSASDPHAEKTVMDLIKGCHVRVFPVGRLDKNTTGILMFTNDGEIAEQLTHPSYNKKKIYQVILDKALEESDKEKILTDGLELSDGNIKADELEYIDAEDHRKLGIEIHSGKNRIVRRIFESLGYTVKALDRVYFAGLTKKGLKKGEWRFLSEGEVNVLKMGAYV